jgi:ribosomal protein S14
MTDLPKVDIFRVRRSDHGTEGILLSGVFYCMSMELPWRKNARNISCIPPGTYHVKIRYSRKYRRVYWVTKVNGRTWILIHAGNWAGDVQKGLRTHTNGCILTGKYHGWLCGQRAVLLSRITLRRFMKHIPGRKFTLNIHEAFGRAA